MPKIQVRRGLKANLPRLSEGEFGFTTDTSELFIGGQFNNTKISVDENKLIPTGGTAGQVLKKVSSSDHSVAWGTPSGEGGGGLYLPPRANRVGVIGDSNTAAGWQMRDTREYHFPTWASMAAILSDQRINISANVAVSGYTSHSAATNQSDWVIADNPGKCLIMIGTNDVWGIDNINATKANLTAAADKLVAADIEPIFMTIYPMDDGAKFNTGNDVIVTISDAQSKINQINAFIKQFCESRGYQCIDVHPVLLNPVNGKISTGTDGIHAQLFGSRKVAEMVVAELAPRMPVWTPTLSRSNTDPRNMLSNPLMLNLTAEQPDGWIKVGAMPTRIDPGIGIFGKWFTFYNATGSTLVNTNTKISQTVATGFTVGDKIAVGGKVRVREEATGGSIYAVRMIANGGTTPQRGGPTLNDPAYSPILDFQSPLEGTFYQVYTIPSGTTSLTFEIEVKQAQPRTEFSFGQLSAYNLTRMEVVV